jgi:prepilin peptidase CpaA
MSPDGFDMKTATYVAIFCGAIAQDILWRKVKNAYVILAFLFAFLIQWSQVSFTSSIYLLQNILISFLLGFALYLLKILGAGDVKIFAASSLLLQTESIPIIYFYALFWGSLFGIIRYAIGGKLLTLIQNMVLITNGITRKSVIAQPIPFTVAFLLGAMTDWALKQHGVNFL